MKSLLLWITLLCPSICLGQWTVEQKTLAAVASVALLVDYGQTKSIVRSDRFSEQNPMLPRHPSSSDVARHFILTPIIAYLVLDNIDSESRTWALRALTLVQIGVVAHNYSLGIRMSF
jgi:hypothetical protein